MAISFEQVDYIPVMEGGEFIYPHLKKEDYHYSARVFQDTAWSSDPDRPVVLYFHGSGQVPHYETDHGVVSSIVDRGYIAIGFMNFRSGTSSTPPDTSGYGDTGGPQYLQSMVAGARRVQAAIEFAQREYTGHPVFLMGQSAGTIASLAWSSWSNMPEFSSARESVYGILGNGGLSGGGLGTYTWNSFDRNLAIFGELIQQVQHRTVACWATNDAFAPPDMVRRWHQMLPADSPVYVVSPGDMEGGHSWLPRPGASSIWGEWLTSLVEGTPILVNGVPAIQGPVS